MAGFTGGRKPLGMAGIPPAIPGPTVSETASNATDTYFLLGFDLAEDINPTGSSNPPVRVTESDTNGSDTFFILGFVLAESGAPGSSGGSFRVTEKGSVGSDTYFILGIVLSEK